MISWYLEDNWGLGSSEEHTFLLWRISQFPNTAPLCLRVLLITPRKELGDGPQRKKTLWLAIEIFGNHSGLVAGPGLSWSAEGLDSLLCSLSPVLFLRGLSAFWPLEPLCHPTWKRFLNTVTQIYPEVYSGCLEFSASSTPPPTPLLPTVS